MIQEKHIDTYPYRLGENSSTVRRAMGFQYGQLLEKLDLSDCKKQALFDFFCSHFIKAENLYLPEEIERNLGKPRANLFYHLKDHGVYQAGYDATGIAKAIITTDSHLKENLSLEALVTLPIAAMYHDSGYVTADPETQNYASLTPVHVRESMNTFSQAMSQFPLPDFLDTQKAIRLGQNGIHQTYFPQTDTTKLESQEMIQNLPFEERKEAMILRLAVQLADLGGQVARRDYYPDLVKDLRKELNAVAPCLGLKIIGSDEELLQNTQKFSKNIVIPTVGKTANAFFGKHNSFSKIWQELLSL